MSDDFVRTNSGLWVYSCLYRKLHPVKINTIGTVRLNMRNMPKEFATLILRRFQVLSRTCNGILAAKWKDKKDIYLLSIKHNNIEMIKMGKKKWKNNNNPNKTVTKPEVVLDNNDGMGEVDLQNSYSSSFLMMRKYAKGYKKYFFI